MYYEEKIIDGALHHRSVPNGKWIPFTTKELTDMYIAARLEHERCLAT